MWISISFFNPVGPEEESKMTGGRSNLSRFLVGVVLGCALALFVNGSGVHYKNLLKYTERNYMRGRKNERKLRRYGERLSKHEVQLQHVDSRIQKVEGFGR
jgi:hypothetical protein